MVSAEGKFTRFGKAKPVPLKYLEQRSYMVRVAMGMDFKNLFSGEGMGGLEINKETFIHEGVLENRAGEVDLPVFENVRKVWKKRSGTRPGILSRYSNDPDRLRDKTCHRSDNRVHAQSSMPNLILQGRP